MISRVKWTSWRLISNGNDYWVWKAISALWPRVLIAECRPQIPANLSLTIPYDPEFSLESNPPDLKEFYGASLLAMTKLSRSKGYRLIGAHRFGFNVIFLREDVGTDI